MAARKTHHASALRVLRLTVLSILLSLSVGHAQAERRAAIVVGNSDYAFSPLPNPKQDAKLIASTLGELDFDVLLFYDVKKAAAGELKEAIRAHLIGADIAVLYYAGHGIQYRRQNLLLPVDVRTESADAVVEDSIALNDLIDIVKDDPVGIKLIILDACRDNPLAEEDGLEKGLANIESGTGQVLIAFATGAGEVAFDGTGVNSPYSSALANALQKSDLDVYDTFRTVRGDVRLATSGAQIPWITGSIETRFVFRKGSLEGLEPGVLVTSGEEVTIDQVLWNFIKESPDPTDFERFAKVFPNSDYTETATKRSQVQVSAVSGRGLYINGELQSAPLYAELPPDADQGALGDTIVFKQAGERVVSETFRVWPRVLPDTRFGLKTIVTDCDLYAADPVDPQRVVPGVSNGLVNVRSAVRACAFAAAADAKNPRTLFQLGRVLEIAGQYDWAEHFYKEAGELNYSAALTNLGHMYRVGLGRPIDYTKALDYFISAANLGNLRARTNVGAAFIRGQGVPPSPQEGILWYRLASSSGWSNAINALADTYRRGDGVEVDPEEAAKLYEVAVSGGHIDAMSSLGRAYLAGAGVEKDPQRGLDLLSRATEMGNKYAPYFAGQLYLKGASGLKRKPEEALRLLELSSRRGFEDAYVALSAGYREGAFSKGKPDLEKAYFNAALAVQFKKPQGAEDQLGFGMDKAEAAKSSIAKELGEAARKRIDDQVDLFVQQNGL